VVDKASAVMTRMNVSTVEVEGRKGHSCGRQMERDKRKINGARILFSDWQDYLLVSQLLAGGEGEKPLGGCEE